MDRRLTFDPLFDRFPLWSPDVRRVAFSSQRDGIRGNLFWQTADGTGQAERLAKSANNSQLFPFDGVRIGATPGVCPPFPKVDAGRRQVSNGRRQTTRRVTAMSSSIETARASAVALTNPRRTVGDS
jgi:hypothetical protein